MDPLIFWFDEVGFQYLPDIKIILITKINFCLLNIHPVFVYFFSLVLFERERKEERKEGRQAGRQIDVRFVTKPKCSSKD